MNSIVDKSESSISFDRVEEFKDFSVWDFGEPPQSLSEASDKLQKAVEEFNDAAHGIEAAIGQTAAKVVIDDMVETALAAWSLDTERLQLVVWPFGLDGAADFEMRIDLKTLFDNESDEEEEEHRLSFSEFLRRWADKYDEAAK